MAAAPAHRGRGGAPATSSVVSWLAGAGQATWLTGRPVWISLSPPLAMRNAPSRPWLARSEVETQEDVVGPGLGILGVAEADRQWIWPVLTSR